MKFNQVSLSCSIPLRQIQLGLKRVVLTHNGDCRGYLVPLEDWENHSNIKMPAPKFLKNLQSGLCNYGAVVLTQQTRPIVLWVHPKNYFRLPFSYIGGPSELV